MWHDAQARRRRVATVAITLALHGTILYFVLVPRAPRAPNLSPKPPALEVTFYTVTRRPSATSKRRSARRSSPRTRTRRKELAAPTPMIVAPISEPRPNEIPRHDWMYWDNALSQEMHRIESRSARTAYGLRTGFPRSVVSPASVHGREWNGWDYAATHRIEVLPKGGGILINLNDYCAILIHPFPMFGCSIWHIPVKGDLFKYMGDYSSDGLHPFENPRYLDGHRAKRRGD